MNESNEPQLCVEIRKKIKKYVWKNKTSSKSNLKHYKNASVHCIGKYGLGLCNIPRALGAEKGVLKRGSIQVRLAPWETAINVALD